MAYLVAARMLMFSSFLHLLLCRLIGGQRSRGMWPWSFSAPDCYICPQMLKRILEEGEGWEGFLSHTLSVLGGHEVVGFWRVAYLRAGFGLCRFDPTVSFLAVVAGLCGGCGAVGVVCSPDLVTARPWRILMSFISLST